MSTLGLSLTLGNEVQLNRTLLGLRDRPDDMRPAWNVIADDLMDFEKRQFSSEGAAGSGGWQPLAPATIALKQAVGKDNGILHFTGDLMRSLTVKGDAAQVLVINPHQMAFGTTDPKAALHQKGTGNMPARKPLDLPESVRRDLMKVVQRYWVTGSPR